MAAVVVIVKRQREAVARFIAAEATTPRTARTFDELGVARRWYFERMIAFGVFVSAGDERYYVVPEVWETYRRHKRQRALVITVILIGILVLAMSLKWLT